MNKRKKNLNEGEGYYFIASDFINSEGKRGYNISDNINSALSFTMQEAIDFNTHFKNTGEIDPPCKIVK